MTLPDAIDVLRKGRKVGREEEEAMNAIKLEIVSSGNIRLTFATLAARLTESTNPTFSYRIMRCILEAGGEKIEDDIALRGLFIRKVLSNTTVREGLIKCMVALSACTKVTGE